MVDSPKRSNTAERSARYRARKKEAAKLHPASASGTQTKPFHQMQLELENSKRENDRLQTMVDDLTRQMHNAAPMVQQPSYFPPLGSNLLGSNLGVNRMPAPPPAEPVPVARPQAPSFAPGLDVQLAMINSHHDSNKFRKLG